jgi:hypothetical protein
MLLTACRDASAMWIHTRLHGRGANSGSRSTWMASQIGMPAHCRGARVRLGVAKPRLKFGMGSAARISQPH